MDMSELPPPAPTEPPPEGWLPDRLSGSTNDRGDMALAGMIAAAQAGATAEELAGEEAVLTAYRAAMGAAPAAASTTRAVTVTSARARRAREGGRGLRLLAARSTAAVVAAVATITLGGVATAAYTGVLPAALQDFAHRHIGAPLPGHGIWAHHENPVAQQTLPASAHSSAGGPHGAPGAASRSQVAMVAGLCEAVAKGRFGPTSHEYRVLVSAAGGADKVPQLCATVHRPGQPRLTPPHTNPTVSPAAASTARPLPTGGTAR